MFFLDTFFKFKNNLFILFLLFRCEQGDVVTHTAWLNRSSILYAGEDKWSVDPRVSLVTLNQEEFTIKIENVDMTDEGQYVCAVQTSSRPRTTSVHVLVQGKWTSKSNLATVVNVDWNNEKVTGNTKNLQNISFGKISTTFGNLFMPKDFKTIYLLLYTLI